MDIYSVANQMKMERKTIFDLDIRVTYYARVSTTREEQENSIENQILFFEDMIQKNANWTFVPGYVDRVRGESAANRDQFMKMIDDARAGAFDLILTKEVSRFARDTIDSLTYTRELLRMGVGVYFQNDNLCTIDTDSEMRLTIMSSIAADEVRKLSERVRWGHKRSIEKGAVLGNSRIFGYDKKDCRLVINEPEAEMVRLIFQLYSTGEYSVRKIADELGARGHVGRNGTKIHHNTVSGIIQNPKYKGYFCGNKVRIVDYRTKKQRFLPKEEWIMYKDESGKIVPAIVDEALWDKCNEIFKERSQAIKARERSFKGKSAFTGKIWCASHKKPYWRTSYSNSASKGKPIYQWICSEKKRTSAECCSSFAIMEDELYVLLSEFFQNIAENIEDYITTFLEIYRDTDIAENYAKDIASAKARIEKEKAKKDKLLELYMESAITKAEFTERNDASNVLITELEESIHQLTQKAEQSDEYAQDLRKIETYFKTSYTPGNVMDKAQVDEMVLTLIERIDVIPINDTEMRLEIKLKTGRNSDIVYARKGGRRNCCSDHTFLIMSPEQQWRFRRESRILEGHQRIVIYKVIVGI